MLQRRLACQATASSTETALASALSYFVALQISQATTVSESNWAGGDLCSDASFSDVAVLLITFAQYGFAHLSHRSLSKSLYSSSRSVFHALACTAAYPHAQATPIDHCLKQMHACSAHMLVAYAMWGPCALQGTLASQLTEGWTTHSIHMASLTEYSMVASVLFNSRWVLRA